MVSERSTQYVFMPPLCPKIDHDVGYTMNGVLVGCGVAP
jgi:hypothetical protein